MSSLPCEKFNPNLPTSSDLEKLIWSEAFFNRLKLDQCPIQNCEIECEPITETACITCVKEKCPNLKPCIECVFGDSDDIFDYTFEAAFNCTVPSEGLNSSEIIVIVVGSVVVAALIFSIFFVYYKGMGQDTRKSFNDMMNRKLDNKNKTMPSTAHL